MSIASEVERIKTNISNTYTALENKGATIPENKNSDNLVDTVDSISGGGTSVYTPTTTDGACILRRNV